MFCSLRSPVVQGMQMITCKQVIQPVKLQPKMALIEDLNTCTSVVEFKPSPVKKLLWDLDNLTRKRTFEFVAGIGDQRQLPMRMTLSHDHVYDLVQLSIRKRRKFNANAADLPCLEPSVVSSELACTRKPLLALEWEAEQPDEWPADFETSEEDESWYVHPAMTVISDICEMTSKLGHRVPKAAMFLWAQLLQLFSCSKKFLTCEENEEGRGRNEVIREPPQGCYLSTLCRGASEGRTRAVAEKKTKKQVTKKNLKRAHGALIQKSYNSTNRKRAMDFGRFQRACGRRGC